MARKSTCSRIEAAYIAGLTDGEGCVRLNKRGSGFFPIVAVTQKDPMILDWLIKKLEMGRVFKKSTCYEWRITNEGHVLEFHSIVSPYMKIKRGQMEVLVDSLDSRGRDRKWHYGQLRLMKHA